MQQQQLLRQSLLQWLGLPQPVRQAVACSSSGGLLRMLPL
jgi:hypothetical protein